MCRIAFLAFLMPWFCGSEPANAQGLQVFFGNLHSHTSFSDGRGTPEDAYAHGRDVAGLDFLAVTEHNHRRAPSRIATDHSLYNGPSTTSLIQTAGRFDEDDRFVAIFGQEFSSIGSGNHANVLEVTDVIDQAQVANGAWDDLLNTWLPTHLDASGQQALLLLNHPATSSSPNSQEYGIDDFPGNLAGWLAALDARAQLINIINGPSHDSTTPGTPSQGEFRRYLNLGFHLAPTADQDNHRRNWGSAADTRTGVIATRLTKADIMAALRARHVYATEDRNLRLVPRIAGQLIGTRLAGGTPAAGSTVTVSLDITDDDEPFIHYVVEVISDELGGGENATVAATFGFDDNGTHQGTFTYPGGQRYYFLRVTQEHDDVDGDDRAWTAPVWFEPGGGAPPPAIAAFDLDIDVVAETATITNSGGAPQDMSGWQLISERGNQRFTFQPGFTLAAGATVTVVSGSAAVDNPPIELLWTSAHRWANSGDPGRLEDSAGNVMATDP